MVSLVQVVSFILLSTCYGFRSHPTKSCRMQFRAISHGLSSSHSWSKIVSHSSPRHSQCRRDLHRLSATSNSQQKQQQNQKQQKNGLILSEGNGNNFLDESFSESKEGEGKLSMMAPLLLIGIAAAAAFAHQSNIFDDLGIGTFLQDTVNKVASLGPYGYFYFAAIYILAEVLAIPVFPLTSASGYLFGLVPGTITVLLSATVAACVSFYIGRTYLRQWALEFTKGNKKWDAIDKAISKEGFKVILLLRLSPLLPFAISNYLYGITSVDFFSFFVGTLLGFAPGTFGFVYAGTVGKELFSGGVSGLPWYAYAAGFGFITFFGQTVAKIAKQVIQDLEKEEESESTKL